MIDRPIYYKEARALVMVVGKCRLFIECSPFPACVRTDHAPLQWMKHARRGPLAAWRIEELAGLDYTVEYIDGAKNVLADALTRFPLIAHQVPTLEGLDAMLLTIMETLGSKWRCAQTLWIWFDRDTSTLARQVQAWRQPTNPLIKLSPSDRALRAEWDVALMAPAAELAPVVCAQLFSVGKPFACLVPNELVSWIPVSVNQGGDQDVKAKLDATRKITFLAAGFTWVVHGESKGEHLEDRVFHLDVRASGDDDTELATQGGGDENKTIFSTLSHKNPAEDPGVTTDKGQAGGKGTSSSRLGDHSLWIEEQARDESELKKESEHIVRHDRGLLLHAPPGSLARILVPKERREALTMAAHERIMHRGWKKTLDDLRKTYFWKTMSSDVKRWVSLCTKCDLSKRRRLLAHGQFSNFTTDGPRIAWALDYVKMATSRHGNNYWLTAMDLFTHLLLLTPTRTRSAKEACIAIRDRIIFRFGVPSWFISDEEKAFLSGLMQGLESLLGIRHISSTAYNPRAIAALERAHLFLGECCRMLPVEDRPDWDTFGARWEFAFNTVTCSTTSFTPFELDSGQPARTVTSTVAISRGSAWNPDEKKAVGMYGNIREAAATYRQCAIEATARAKEDQSALLNRTNRTRVEYQVGEKVCIYMPGRAVGDDWRPKHSNQWAGPMVVTQRESDTIYEVQEETTGRFFRRHVSNMNAYRANEPAARDSSGELHSPGDASDPPPTDFKVGNIVAFSDEDDEKFYWLGTVLRLEGDDAAQVHYRGTTSKKIKSARFLPVHIESPSGLSILAAKMTKRLLSPGCTSEPWTGVIDAEDIYDFNVQMTASDRISAKSRRALSLRGLKHKIMM